METESRTPQCRNDRTVVAVDLGAESCRVSLVRHYSGAGSVELVHRFPNAPLEKNGHLYWDINSIVAGVEQGLRKCAAKCERIDSIGVDGWAVDYVRVNADGDGVSTPFCYRDQRTEARQPEFWKKCLSRGRLYQLTGIQMLRFNTLYQLYADACDGIAPGEFWLNIPEFVLYRLGGKPVAEYSNATHTQMVEAGKMRWCREIFERGRLHRGNAPNIVPPGTILGKVGTKLSHLPAFAETALIAPACHDTGSAVAGIPATGADDWAFLISGTWSLVGTLLPAPNTSRSALNKNFSNEGGIGGQIRFLKNVNGMWLLQQCMRQWQSRGQAWNIEDLIAACLVMPKPKILLDVDDPELLLPGNMIRRINRVLAKSERRGLSEEPAFAPELANVIFHSLARKYAQVLRDLSRITQKRFRRLYVVGGGSKNVFLNSLVAEFTGLEVLRGPAEASTVGNAAIQLAVLNGSTSPRKGVNPKAVSEWSRRIAEDFRFIETDGNSRVASATR